jgi:MFS family permease
VGLVAVLVGAALTAPALLDLAGRHPPRRPTVLRLAARDAARQPGRSGPAVAAIAAALGFMVVLASQVPNHSYLNGYTYQPEPLLWSPPFPVALRVLLGLVAGVTVLVVLVLLQATFALFMLGRLPENGQPTPAWDQRHIGRA